MFFAGSRRLLHLSLVVLLGVTVLQMWVCWHSCQVGAIRVFPSTNAMAKAKFNHGIEDEKVKEDLLHKHFSGRTFGLSNGTQKGFDENKRRVPSCPDPLHN
ncbi:CLAVATA3/ESR (CLE)-related protein 27 [Spatholobus suberectus]|nr:CLAVATA3/ESR (CLE)-related protein 27 [Spatholobus suberectus]